MPIAYHTENVNLPEKFKKNQARQWIKKIILNHDKTSGAIAFIFCDDTKILEINRQFLQSDYYTDIITFDYTKDDILSGDLYISVDTVKSNSEKFKTEFLEELYRVMIHGILHLCGMTDKTEDERKQMTMEENKALEILRTMIKF